MKSILLHIHADDQQDARTGAAIDVARHFGAHVHCLQVTTFDQFIGADPFGGVYLYDDALAAIRKQEAAERVRIETWLKREQIDWAWQQLDGDAARTIVDCAALADLVVLSQPVHGRTGKVRPLPVLASVAIHGRTPVLAVPSNGRDLAIGGVAMVAWNGSSESATALRLALPMLKAAASVSIVEVADDTSDRSAHGAIAYLERYGIAATTHREAHDGRLVANALEDVARNLGAAYIVMGAYGHARLLETVVGGVTRDLLGGCNWPLLLAH